MQTRYRIRSADGAPIFEGKRSRVKERLATRRLRDKWGTLQIDICKYDPRIEDCPKWRHWGSAADFVAQKQ